MNTTEAVFRIKDMENISRIKAHTIKIWEKRYNLLSPKRTDTNIRHYDLENLKKLLNISFLNNNGLKISIIAALKASKLTPKTRELAFMGKSESQAINAIKLSCLILIKRFSIIPTIDCWRRKVFERFFMRFLSLCYVTWACYGKPML